MDFLSIIWQSLSITLFVISMMLVIEYINVLTKGIWSTNLQQNPWKQVLLGALLGLIPGCLGAYTAVSLYVHNILGLGALVATMVATSGDEAFFMFSIIPETALMLMAGLFVIAVASGFIVNAITGKKKLRAITHFHIHADETESFKFGTKKIFAQLLQPSRVRLTLLIVLVVSIILVALNFEEILYGLLDHDHSEEGSHAHIHPRWIGVTFMVVLGLSLFVVATVGDHFLKEHLLNHIIKKHLLRIFLWTFLTLIILYALRQYFSIEELISENLFLVLIIAVLVGIIPESGPHLVFILLFATGDIPVSILLASSIAQDGHGSLPLLAESPRSFIKVKLINMLIAFVVGGGAMLTGM